MQTAGKGEHQQSQKQNKTKQKRVTYKGETEKEPTIERNGDFSVKELSEMEANKLSDIKFKRMVIWMLKELNDKQRN